jgi:hypothetical protein
MPFSVFYTKQSNTKMESGGRNHTLLPKAIPGYLATPDDYSWPTAMLLTMPVTGPLDPASYWAVMREPMPDD